jgi:hypothetical protein
MPLPWQRILSPLGVTLHRVGVAGGGRCGALALLWALNPTMRSAATSGRTVVGSGGAVRRYRDLSSSHQMRHMMAWRKQLAARAALPSEQSWMWSVLKNSPWFPHDGGAAGEGMLTMVDELRKETGHLEMHHLQFIARADKCGIMVFCAELTSRGKIQLWVTPIFPCGFAALEEVPQPSSTAAAAAAAAAPHVQPEAVAKWIAVFLRTQDGNGHFEAVDILSHPVGDVAAAPSLTATDVAIRPLRSDHPLVALLPVDAWHSCSGRALSWNHRRHRVLRSQRTRLTFGLRRGGPWTWRYHRCVRFGRRTV